MGTLLGRMPALGLVVLVASSSAWGAPPVGYGAIRWQASRKSRPAQLPVPLAAAVATLPSAGAALAPPPELPPSENSPAGGGLIVPDIAEAYVGEGFVRERAPAVPPRIKPSAPHSR